MISEILNIKINAHASQMIAIARDFEIVRHVECFKWKQLFLHLKLR